MSKYIFPVLFTSLLTLSACSPEEQQEAKEIIRPVKTIVVEASSIVQQKSYPAIVLPAQQAELSFRSSGQIIEMPVKAASIVKEDDVIAKLDTRDFISQVTALESQMEQAQAQLDGLTSGARAEDVASLKAGIKAAEAQVNAARQQMSRTQQLFDKGIVAKAKLDGDKANLDVAAAQLEAARQELIKGETGGRKEEVAAQIAAIKGIEANLNVAKDNLANATLRAPFGGIIAQRDVDNFANIQAKQTIVVLQKLDKLELSFDIPGPDVSKADRDNPATIKVQLDAIKGKTYDAELVEFNTIANSSTQTFTGRVAIDQPIGATILPGMTGQVSVIANTESTPVINIPATALASEPDGSTYVWVISDDKAAKRQVKTSNAAGSDVTISEGLEDGEVVVTAGVSFLQEGMKVRATAGKE